MVSGLRMPLLNAPVVAISPWGPFCNLLSNSVYLTLNTGTGRDTLKV